MVKGWKERILRLALSWDAAAPAKLSQACSPLINEGVGSNEDKFTHLLTSLENITNPAGKTRRNKSSLVIPHLHKFTPTKEPPDSSSAGNEFIFQQCAQ